MKSQLSADYPRRQQDQGPSHEDPYERTGQSPRPYEEHKAREGEKELLRLRADQERLLQDEERRRQSALIFTDKTIRNAFIRKVYSVLTMQLVVAGIVVVCIHNNKPLKTFFSIRVVIWGMIGLFLVLNCVMICCVSLLRTVPINFIILSIYSAIEGVFLFVITLRYSLDTVLTALGITALICFFLTLFAFQTSIDFTSYLLFVLVILIVFVIAGLVLMFFKPSRPKEIVYGSLVVILFSIFLVIDTQMIIGGKHQYAFSPEDYALASVNLFLDIINIFVYLLRILGED